MFLGSGAYGLGVRDSCISCSMTLTYTHQLRPRDSQNSIITDEVTVHIGCQGVEGTVRSKDSS